MSGGAGQYLKQLLGGQMNAIPGASGMGSPTMSGYGYNWYGGQPLIPQGGRYNQMAQAMAGPSYAPPGANWYSQPGSSSYGGKGASPAMQPHYGPQPRPAQPPMAQLPWMGSATFLR